MSNFVSQLVSAGDNNLHAKTFESRSWTVFENEYTAQIARKRNTNLLAVYLKQGSRCFPQ